mmetsp:Transcript_41129/g.97436  ORF Transcript_41129/g.97436 Transcript_41129/m.97436 type:complete len:254 (+) Transcript_41129:2-763(+)
MRPADLALRLACSTEEVARWFAESSAWRARHEILHAGPGSTRRMHQDPELLQCRRAQDWPRVHALLLQLLVAEDLEDSADPDRPHPRTLELFREVAAGMIRARAVRAWDQGAGPLLSLLEVWEQLSALWEQLARLQEADEARAEEAVGLFLSRLVAQVHLAAKQLHHLPPATQREALEMCTKVVGSVWQGCQGLQALPLSSLSLPPSRQLLYLNKLAAEAQAAMGEVQGLDSGGGGGDAGGYGRDMDYETEEC